MEEDEEGRARIQEALARAGQRGPAASGSGGPGLAAGAPAASSSAANLTTASGPAAAAPASSSAAGPANSQLAVWSPSSSAGVKRSKLDPNTQMIVDAGQQQTAETEDEGAPRKRNKEDMMLAVMTALGSMDIGSHMDDEHVSWEQPQEEDEQFIDNISGALLDPNLVREARRKDIDFVHQFGVYEKVPEACAVGKIKVSIKWVDINKGDTSKPEYRSRLVGRELRVWDPFMSGTFAATPPTEALRFMLSSFMTKPRTTDAAAKPTAISSSTAVRSAQRNRVLIVLDVSRAHFHPPAEREVYIDLPREDSVPGMIGRLKRTIYGTRDAASAWERFYTEAFKHIGFIEGVFFRPAFSTAQSTTFRLGSMATTCCCWVCAPRPRRSKRCWGMRCF